MVKALSKSLCWMSCADAPGPGVGRVRCKKGGCRDREGEPHCGGRQLGLLPLLVKEARKLVAALVHVAAGLIEGPAVMPDEADVVCHRACACVETALQALRDGPQVHWVLQGARMQSGGTATLHLLLPLLWGDLQASAWAASCSAVHYCAAPGAMSASDPAGHDRQTCMVHLVGLSRASCVNDAT